MSYYTVVSRLNGLVLDLENGGNKPVPRLVPWKRNGSPSQLWYDHPETNTIRNKLNNYCIDLESDVAIVKPYQEGDPNQEWERSANCIRKKRNHHKVLDILKSNPEPGAEIGPTSFHSDLSQMFDFEFIDDSPWGAGPARDPSLSARRFYIVSEWNQLVVDISGCEKDEGGKIITWPKNDDIQRNQLWYFDQQGYIRSDLNDMVFSAEEPGDKLKTKKFDSNDHRGLWVYDEKTRRIYNRTGEVLDIRGEHEGKGGNLCSYEFKGAPNQRWRIQYA